MKSDRNSLRRQPQQKRSRERVEKILDAAAIVFDEVGFETATTHAIAARANTAVGSLYQFFPDKLAIFNALELRHVERVRAIWERLFSPEIVQLPFPQFVSVVTTQFQKLFEQPTSRIVFSLFFTSPTIFKNIDASFTQEAIQFMAKLLKARNPLLPDKRSYLLAEVCVHGINTLILLAIRSSELHQQKIFTEIEALMRAYLEPDIGDRIIKNNRQNNVTDIVKKIASKYHLNQRQCLILEYAIANAEVTVDKCEIIFPQVSRRTIQRDIGKMVKRNLLMSKGHTNNRRYQINLSISHL